MSAAALDANGFSAFFGGISALAASVAVFLSVRIHRENLKLQHNLAKQTAENHRMSLQMQSESEARNSWADYMAFAVQYPEFSGGFNKGWLHSSNVEREFERYEWYVSKLMLEAEEILKSFVEDKAWRTSLMQQFDYHASYIEGEFSKYLEHYSDDLQALILEWRTNLKTKAIRGAGG